MGLCAWSRGPSHALGTAGRRPGTRPPGRAPALRLGRLLAGWRRPWPRPPLLVRGASPGAPRGVRGAGPATRARWGLRLGRHGRRAPSGCAPHAGGAGALPAAERPSPGSGRAPACQQPCVGGMRRGGRVRGPALAGPGPRRRHGRWRPSPRRRPLPGGAAAAGVEDLDGARGHCDTASKAVQGALQSDRTSATTFPSPRHATLAGVRCRCPPPGPPPPHADSPPAGPPAPPTPLRLTRCKVAPPGKPDQARMLLHLPTSCPGAARLLAVPQPLAPRRFRGKPRGWRTPLQGRCACMFGRRAPCSLPAQIPPESVASPTKPFACACRAPGFPPECSKLLFMKYPG